RNNGVLVDIGYKSEGFVPAEEFKNWEQVKVGDKIKVLLENIEDERNMPVLSVNKAEFLNSWNNLVKNHKEGDVIKGLIKARVKGGFTVEIEGVDAFLPGSQLDIAPVKSMDDFVGKEYDVKILKINEERKNVVVSRRELLEEDRAGKRAAILKEIKLGDVKVGIVKNITDFGAFIDLGGLDGLLHITDMSWKRINHPSEMLTMGQQIEVKIIDIDEEKGRVSLGLKQKTQDPWESITEKYPVGSKVKGKVVNLMPYGAFIEIEEGVEGLIHVSEMSWTKRITRASEVMNLGDEVEAVVLDIIQKDQKKLSLGLRQTVRNPWEILAEKYPAGSKIKGKVRNMTSYGAFIEIEEGIDGMIHVSDMSWTRKINNPAEMLSVGQEIEAVVLEIDPAQQRISLGIKQLESDPWAEIDNLYKVGDVVKGKITKITAFGAFVEMTRKIDGLIHISQISTEHVKRVKDVLKIGQEVEAKVIKVDKENRRIGLSIKAMSMNISEEELKAVGEEVSQALGNAMAGVGEMLDEDSLAALDQISIEQNVEENK
ncbi:MAG TPA: 30S ribosomal protein S1, partial [Victivallales bacterium]|nr:30S ribosomal protein S1 [Victivallales bacterium]